MHNISKFILFWSNALHVSDGLSVHHQDSKTVHTASGICHTGSVVACQRERDETYFILEQHSTCFGRSLRPSSGVQDCTYSIRYMSYRFCGWLLEETRWNLFYFGTTFYMFRTVSPSIIRSLRLYIQRQVYVIQVLWLLARGNKMKLILFWNNTLHVSDGLSVHHQESKTVRTASYHTGFVAACYQAATGPVWYDAVCTVLDSWW